MNSDNTSILQYQKPPKEILDLVDISFPPMIRLDSKAKNMILIYRDSYKSIQELSVKELRLGGLRIDPKTNISSRIRYYNNISIQKTHEKKTVPVSGLPDHPNLAYFGLSPDEKKMAFTHTTIKGVELWVLDIEKATAIKLTEDCLNANMGIPYVWSRDSEHFIVKRIPSDKIDLIEPENVVPIGPTISENLEGKKAQNRTYQDLLKNTYDETNFEQLVRSELYKVGLDGKKTLWKEAAMYKGVSFSPNGEFLFLTEIQRPFSYLVPYGRFPFSLDLYQEDGTKIKNLLQVPLIEDLPQGFMAVRKGRRNVSWRLDQAATLFWVEALDEGDPSNEVDYRDEVLEENLMVPTQEPRSLFKTKNRFYSIDWGNEEYAIAYDYWWNTRNIKAYLFQPNDPQQNIEIIYDRNYQDLYNDPGNFILEKNKWGKHVLVIDQKHLYLQGTGYSEKGKNPFIDKMDMNGFQKERIWTAPYKDKLELIAAAIDIRKGKIITRIESPDEYPNYHIRNIFEKEKTPSPLTLFENPFKSMEDVQKEIIHYTRKDGVELSGTLYLPSGYQVKKEGRLPLILWAYPKEFKDKDSAGQTTQDPNEFTYPHYGSPIFWVNRGYAVLDNASFPIIGENEQEPNDTFIEQLVANAKAAIDYLDQQGCIDPERVAVGGHSYGAFMTANLLSHSNLFAAGIARSGAYNRTLTPFGFQSEERNLWEAQNIYLNMSPFMHAHKMKTPLLIIHGEADNNPGTYPMQSERYFNALKGLGATVRLVMLPKESHGYVAKESILHMLWEQDRWLEQYVKNKLEKN